MTVFLGAFKGMATTLLDNPLLLAVVVVAAYSRRRLAWPYIDYYYS